jgi:hypothetical protein
MNGMSFIVPTRTAIGTFGMGIIEDIKTIHRRDAEPAETRPTFERLSALSASLR